MIDGVLMVTGLPGRGADAQQRTRLACRVSRASGGVASVAMDGQGVREVAADQIPKQDGRQQHCMPRPAMDGGVRGDSGQAGPFGVQPSAGGLRVGEHRRRGSRR